METMLLTPQISDVQLLQQARNWLKQTLRTQQLQLFREPSQLLDWKLQRLANQQQETLHVQVSHLVKLQLPSVWKLTPLNEEP
jgi:hypothetical protein